MALLDKCLSCATARYINYTSVVQSENILCRITPIVCDNCSEWHSTRERGGEQLTEQPRGVRCSTHRHRLVGYGNLEVAMHHQQW